MNQPSEETDTNNKDVIKLAPKHVIILPSDTKTTQQVVVPEAPISLVGKFGIGGVLWVVMVIKVLNAV